MLNPFSFWIMTRFSLAHTLNTLAPYLPPALVSPRALSHVRDNARWLPAVLTDRIYLETRLGPGEAAVDLSFDTSATGYEVITGRNPVISLPAPLSRSDAWRRIQDLYRAFSDASTVLGTYGSQILLEFDIETRPKARSTPGVFVGLKPLNKLGLDTQDSVGKTSLYTQFTHDVLKYLRAEPLPRRVQDQLHVCCAALPKRAELSYTGFMLPRPHHAVRLCITRLPVGAMFDYLEDIGWPGAEKGFRRTLARLVETETMPLLQVDLWDTVKPRTGMEFFFARRPQRAGRFVENGFLDQLVAMQLCTPEKRDALLTWPGSTTLPFPHVFWPTALQRRVNHVKLTWTPDAVTAKAYLFALIDACIG